MGMIFKTIGFTPHTRLASAATSLAWFAMRRRQRKFAATGPAQARRPAARLPLAQAAE